MQPTRYSSVALQQVVVKQDKTEYRLLQCLAVLPLPNSVKLTRILITQIILMNINSGQFTIWQRFLQVVDMNNGFIGGAGKPQPARWHRWLRLCCELRMPSQTVYELLVNKYCADEQQIWCLKYLNTSATTSNRKPLTSDILWIESTDITEILIISPLASLF